MAIPRGFQASAPTAWYSEVERAHDFVLYAAEGDDLGWRAVVVRQVGHQQLH